MISKHKLNFIISLQKKKERESERLFVVEGDKLVREFIRAGAPVVSLVAKQEFIGSVPHEMLAGIGEILSVSYDELKKMSSLKTPHNALAVVAMSKPEGLDGEGYCSFDGLSAALDFVQDPGNFGTIIRAAAWFGINTVYCSSNCVDVYNSKVIQASMGAILHVRVIYTDLHVLFQKALSEHVRIFGTVLDGDSIYSYDAGNSGIILLGNESKGISPEYMPYVTDRIMIPKMGGNAGAGIDSLNVSMAASIIFSEFARRNIERS